MIYFRLSQRVGLIEMKECLNKGGIVIFSAGKPSTQQLSTTSTIDCKTFNEIAEAGEEDDITYESMVFPPPKKLMESCNKILDGLK